MSKDDFVEDDEQLYRRLQINNDIHRYSYDIHGEVEINSKAFFDRNNQPSVDRAKLREFNPALSKWRDTDGIVSLIAGEVREILIENHTVDVIYAPISGNPAHSLIILTPEGDVSKTKQKEAFSTLRRTLALLAIVELKPGTN